MTTPGEDRYAAIRIVDTAPEVDAKRAIRYLRDADWALVPVKGPEAGSVLALPLLLDWLAQANGARLLGFLPTMYKARRGDSRQWLGELERLAATTGARLFPPIADMASLASFRMDGHPYAPLAEAVEEVLLGALVSRAPISFAAAKAGVRQVAAVEDRIADRLAVADIQPSRRNPRHRIDAIAELADSLRAHGLLQPIVVRPVDAGYELIAGHRRLEAAKVLGWTEIAAVVRDETDNQAYILTLVENLQREDLTPKEEAAALEVLIRERSWSTRQVGEAIKRSAMHVSKRLRVFEDPVLAAPVLADQLPVSTAEELLRVPDDERAQFVEQAIVERWGQAHAQQPVVERKVTLQAGQPMPRLATRLRALAAELTEVELPSLSARERREVRRLLQVLSRLHS